MVEIEVAQFVDRLGTGPLLGISGATFVANIFPGLPEEFFVILVGYLVGKNLLTFPMAMLLVIPPLWITDNVLYFAARAGNKYINKIAQVTTGGRLDKDSHFIKSHIAKIVFMSRFVFQVRFLGPFLAGATRMPWRRFTVVNLAALFAYVPFAMFLGWYFEDRITEIVQGVGQVRNAFIMALILIAVIIFIIVIRKKFFSEIRTKN